MSAPSVHMNDIGTQFIVTIVDESGTAVDLSGASTLRIRLKAVGGTLSTKTATLVNSGTDGKIKYTTVSGDLNQAGKWSIQGFVVVSGSEWSSDIGVFDVLKNLT